MPKETVAGATPSDFSVQIGWQRDVDVQIGTIDPRADSQFERESGLWVNLDRRGVNQLIRALRRARDAAYGRDE